ncbi:MAG TPA: SRPBCC family protein [Verrucomicrobiae bacterium]|nr:SRPBCC family protein [Verrucomicrobiae bacterium]
MKTNGKKYNHHVSVPSGKGLRVDKSVTINLPAPEVYSFWRRLENLPHFMRHVEAVREDDPWHSHWRVKTAANTHLEWDAEIIEDEKDRMISWRSIPGADVENAGSVWFTPSRDGSSTRVKVSLKYLPPGGKFGAAAAEFFGAGAKSEIEEDLAELKTWLEHGAEVPQS